MKDKSAAAKTQARVKAEGELVFEEQKDYKVFARLLLLT